MLSDRTCRQFGCFLMLEKQHGLRTVEASLTELDWLRQVEVEAQSTRLRDQLDLVLQSEHTLH